MNEILSIHKLNISFKIFDPKARTERCIQALTDLNLKIYPADVLGIVGESGSGKTQAMLAVMGLLPENAICTGQVFYGGSNLLELPIKELNRIRGNRITMVFQDSMNSLNPYLKIYNQLAEVLLVHTGYGYREIRTRVEEIMHKVCLPLEYLRKYPVELSGGERQRVLLAMALISRPDIIIADEPTTGLDVTIQIELVKLIRQLASEFKVSLIFISHDLGLVFNLANKVLIMYASVPMEYGSSKYLLQNCKHPYTQKLISIARCQQQITMGYMETIEGNMPLLYGEPKNCVFHSRCHRRMERCDREVPPYLGTDSYKLACWLDLGDA